MQCRKCAKDIPSAAKLCPYCGTHVNLGRAAIHEGANAVFGLILGAVLLVVFILIVAAVSGN